MRIVIYGCGQIGRVVNQILKDSGHQIIGYVDDSYSSLLKQNHDLKILGGREWLLRNSSYDRVCLGVGTIDSRKKIMDWLNNNNIPTINAIHPSVITSTDVVIGQNVMIGANTTVYGNIIIGDGTFIGPSVAISHDTFIGECCLISIGSVISARVTIEDSVFIGSGAILVPSKLAPDARLLIAKRSIIGAGSVVIRDVKTGDTVVGIPAKSTSLS